MNIPRPEKQRFRIPAVEIRETPTAVILQAEMPGVDKEDFDIQIDGDELTVKGKRKQLKSDLRVIHQESDSAEYLRSFILGDELDTSAVDAKTENGILTLTLHKKKEAAPQKIAIKSA
ncbi:MAG: Hsp20/alpha crystallin family protein [Candidatus Abyssobacteria bacterium SURF_5]|uniref:Hsp20/alpha crystallin family protein n=1 Tax=Abyssobacteria bacterium (strain SURF_5) TaxID=2093360 RepID=A0A3A4P3R4_ABYX5|nr:MAG: Hsp20/alpha crystallin family protein [Candidatus Abyssubacteria bacterium SURF_5]